MHNNNSLKSIFSQVLLLAFFLGLSVIPTTTYGQKVAVPVDAISDDQLKAYYEKAQSSGMSEAQIEQLALSRGYTSADVARVRERIANLPTGNTQTGGGKGVKEDEIYLPRKQGGELGEKSTKKKLSLDSMLLALPKKEKFDSLRTATELFGGSLFQTPSMSFEPNLRIATPRNYQLGPDDELIIEVTGNNFDTFKAKVSPEGNIKILGLKPIYVNGRTIDQAETIIVNRIRQLYGSVNQPNSGTYAQVTLGDVRSIKVTLTGNIVRPGTYTVSSLATVFNALYAAGGPAENGSFRNIKVIRENKTIRVLDLYDFLLRADKKDDIHLQDQDIILVPDYETHIYLSGEVKRPAIYEVQKGETLLTLLRFAGGFTENAYTNSILLKRNTSKERKAYNISQEEINNFVPQSGDKYQIGKILERFENVVKIKGEVYRPGSYAIEKGSSTVKELIFKAEGLKEGAFLERGIIIRERENFDPEVISFDLGKLMRGQIADIPLVRQDQVQIRSYLELREKRKIFINGAVNKPDEFDYKDNMTIGDLIVLSEGFTESAKPDRIEVARRIKEDSSKVIEGQTVKLFEIAIGANLQVSAEDAKFKLKAFDIVSVRNAPNYEAQKSVYIKGEVFYPGQYTLEDKRERLADLVRRAGSFRTSAFLTGAKLRRRENLVAINLQKALDDNQSNDNILLIEGDTLIIPRRLETVQLQGEVLNPLSVIYKENSTLVDYVAEAGGFTQKAFKSNAYVTYANGSSDNTKHFLFFRKYPKIEPGSIIVIPAEEVSKSKLTTGERIAIISVMGTLMFSLVSIINILKK